MSKKIIFSSLILAGLLIGASVLAAADTATASKVADTLSYPIAELGDCTDKDNCRLYCEQEANMLACVDFGAGKGMISQEEAKLAKKVIPKIIAGQTPGACKSQAECDSYCQSDPSRLSECVAFAEENGILPPEELAQAKKVASVLKAGGKMPGACTNKVSCEKYCEDAANMEECLDFAEKAEILPKDEIAEARKVMKFIQSGETPGGCKTKADCKAYCADDSHFEECISFAEKAGVVSQEEAEIAKKVGGKGPGDCKSQAECDTYCNNPDNAKECANFAIEKGLVSEEEAQKIREGAAELRSSLSKIPADARPEVEACLSSALGADNFAKLKGGEDVSVTKEQGGKIQPCFENAMKAYAEKMQSQAPKDIPAGAPTNIPKPPAGVDIGDIPSVPPQDMPTPPPGAEIPSAPPTNIPSAPTNPPTSSVPPADYKPDAATCAQFQGIPSCDMAGPGKSICEQCK